MITDQIAELDLELFSRVESQTTDDDRRSHLALHHSIASRPGRFSYLEIGSYLGGTLQAMIADPRCRHIVSIDPRPPTQPDERDGEFVYHDNSTDRMIDLLKDVPGADLTKLEAVEASTEDIPPGRFARPDLCFIDGEHTRTAALRDARFCRAVNQGAGIIAFHDKWIVEHGIRDFLRELPRPHRAYALRSEVFVVELGTVSVFAAPVIQAQLKRPRRGWRAANRVGAGASLLALDMRRRQLSSRVQSVGK